MPKTVRPDQLDQVIAEIRKHPNGIGMEALHGELNGSPPLRTLQRRLSELVQLGQVLASGKGRARLYRSAHITSTRPSEPSDDSWQITAEVYVPTSREGEEIKAYVRRPIQQRRPVAYDIAFLEAYTPNHTAYLPEPLRVQLHHMGRSNVDDAAAAGTFARDILNRLLIDLSWASSRLEGNTYTRLDTERLLQFGQAAEGKDALETQMILNHKAAIEYLVSDEHIAVDANTILALHALLSDGLLPNAMAIGRVRQRAVEIRGSVYRPIALPQRVSALFDIVVRLATEIADPFEQAFFLMVHLPYLQPFEDMNKRVSRLAANIPLARHNLSPLSFIDVPAQAYVDGTLGVYELKQVDLLRDVFIWAYERSCQQYTAVRQQLMPPDTFRLQYRVELGAAVKRLVQLGLRTSEDAIARVTPDSVAREDRERFAALLRAELGALHEGNAIRFGLRPLELDAWQRASLRK